MPSSTPVSPLDPSTIISNALQSRPQNFPIDMKLVPFWLTWHPVWNAEKQKLMKPPTGGKNWNDPSKLTTFSTGLLGTRSGSHDPNIQQGYGFAFTSDHPYVCIDLDSMSDSNMSLLTALNTYTELSPSGQGYHCIVEVSDNDKAALQLAFHNGKRSTKNKRDLFISSGYATMTGQPTNIPDAPSTDTEIRVMSANDLIGILEPFFGKSNRIVDLQDKETPTADTQPAHFKLKPAQISKMLAALPVQCLSDSAFDNLSSSTETALLDLSCTDEAREPWLMVGQALHDHFDGSMTGLMIWDNWSSADGAQKYDKNALEASWHSFRANPSTTNKVTLASVVALYKAQAPQFEDLDTKGVPLPTLDNINVFIDHMGFKLRFNNQTLSQEMYVPKVLQKKLSLEHSPWISSIKMASTIVQSELIKIGMPNNRNMGVIRAALTARAGRTSYNVISDFFENELPTWDNTDRIGPLLDTITCSNYARHHYETFLRKWLIQVAAAAYSTREKPNRLSTVLIFQGDQGIGKTNWVESLFPKKLRAFCYGDKDFQVGSFRSDKVKLMMELKSTLICNINEIDTVFTARNYSAFKAFLDQTVDSVVLPYGDAAVPTLRQTVFIGSTNKAQFLHDNTGNRRVFIIKATNLNFKHNIDIDQLWAQVAKMYKDKEVWWLDPNENKSTIAFQEAQNSCTIELADEYSADFLDELFDTEAPFSRWQTLVLKDIKSMIGTHSSHYAQLKTTVAQWLKTIPGSRAPYKATNHPRSRVLYLMPPLRTTFRSEEKLDQPEDPSGQIEKLQAEIELLRIQQDK